MLYWKLASFAILIFLQPSRNLEFLTCKSSNTTPDILLTDAEDEKIQGANQISYLKNDLKNSLNQMQGLLEQWKKTQIKSIGYNYNRTVNDNISRLTTSTMSNIELLDATVDNSVSKYFELINGLAEELNIIISKAESSVEINKINKIIQDIKDDIINVKQISSSKIVTQFDDFLDDYLIKTYAIKERIWQPISFIKQLEKTYEQAFTKKWHNMITGYNDYLENVFKEIQAKGRLLLNSTEWIWNDVLLLKRERELIDKKIEGIVRASENDLEEVSSSMLSNFTQWISALTTRKLENLKHTTNQYGTHLWIETLIKRTLLDFSSKHVSAVDFGSAAIIYSNENIWNLFYAALLERVERRVLPVFVFINNKVNYKNFDLLFTVPSRSMLQILVDKMMSKYMVLEIEGPLVGYYGSEEPQFIPIAYNSTDIVASVRSIDYDKIFIEVALELNKNNFETHGIDVLFVYGGINNAENYGKISILNKPVYTFRTTITKIMLARNFCKNFRGINMDMEELQKKVHLELMFLDSLDNKVKDIHHTYLWSGILHSKEIKLCIAKGHFYSLEVPLSPFFRMSVFLIRIQLMKCDEYYAIPSETVMSFAMRHIVKMNHERELIGYIDSKSFEKSQLYGISKSCYMRNKIYLSGPNHSSLYVVERESVVDKLSLQYSAEDACNAIRHMFIVDILTERLTDVLRGVLLVIHLCESDIDC